MERVPGNGGYQQSSQISTGGRNSLGSSAPLVTIRSLTEHTEGNGKVVT